MSLAIIPSVKRAPYYIVAPTYTRFSAGVRCLHLLCHWLNRQGERAYIVPFFAEDESPINIDLLTPLLTTEIIEHHYTMGVSPIVVYPEVITGNPLEADCVVRWVLNFPGLLGGDKHYTDNETIFCYSKVLAEAVGCDEKILHLPVINTEVFKPNATARTRKGSAVYIGKYQSVHHGEIFGVPDDAIKIFNLGHQDTQTPEEIANIFRSVEVFYVFENTALAMEAILCGCPVVCMVNEWFDKPISLNEFGMDGIAWGNSQDEVKRAFESVEKGSKNYEKLADQFFIQLKEFIELSQTKAALYQYKEKIKKNCIHQKKSGKIKKIVCRLCRILK